MPANMQLASKASPRRVARTQKISSDCSVMVFDYPPYTQPEDLIRTFGKFGHVAVKEMNKKSATLSFSNKEIIKKVLDASKKVQVYGEYLRVTRCNPTPPALVTGELAGSKQKDELVKAADINLSGDFNEQLNCILKAVRLTQEEKISLCQIYTDLEKALGAQWPGCTVVPFGSISTGLGLKNSDADCFINVPANVDASINASTNSSTSVYPNPSTNIVRKAHHALKKYPQIFGKIQPVARANMPIVKLFHIPTETYCDVTFKSLLGIQNSKLIAFLLHSDPRLVPMALVIKYWAKVHNLSGTTKLKNYALSMLIIFYLQQPSVSILPSIQWLQKDPANDRIIDNWNAGFMNQRDMLPASTNTSSISELLGGFFDYYSKFDFEKMVVCPYLGRSIEKELFNDLNLLPDDFERCKNCDANERAMMFKTAMCVQDPFNHLHNIGSPITSRLASNIISYLKYAANAYENEKLNDYKYLFKEILLGKPKLSEMQTEYKINISIAKIINLEWKSILREMVYTIFEIILKIQLDKVEEKQKYDLKNDQEMYLGKLIKPIWTRNQFSQINKTEVEFREEQERITKTILKKEKQLIDMQFLLIMTYSQNPVISIKLTNGDENAFSEFGDFFLTVMNHWYKKLLIPYTKRLD